MLLTGIWGGGVTRGCCCGGGGVTGAGGSGVDILEWMCLWWRSLIGISGGIIDWCGDGFLM